MTPLLFTVYLAAASGRSPALPCFAAFLALVRFSGLFAFTQFFFQILFGVIVAQYGTITNRFFVVGVLVSVGMFIVIHLSMSLPSRLQIILARGFLLAITKYHVTKLREHFSLFLSFI